MRRYTEDLGSVWRDVPVTPAQVALLQHQKDRMSKALQQMASVISKHETGQDKTPASFDVPNLLDKYAPTHSNKRERDAALDYAVQASKRNCIQPPRRPSAPDLPRPSHTRLATYEGGDNHGRAKIIDTNAQFVLEPGPAMQQNAVGNNAFESMLQFMQMMGTSGASSAPDQALNDSSQLPAQNLESIGVGSTAALSPSFIDLVDWEASLANFPDSILNFGNPLPSDNNNNNFVNHEDNSTIESTMDNDDALMRLP
ncbi:uncharacterized protein MYCFIDRAFT_78454 [Pseudocercospora fijiensis CIRAD86]|uniref:Uncharacterized protein n=1 Tax=Pseudocercospora fijiensis (strain CIRAD86) TaxID=383855 RepID=N1QCX7_PSEFD|nr:uncharacterized protein MYCFIDRAFT_78454 [Pseudocercospora fijiensis CIRAD86]EME89767.1 hypothetical protein MYCFIDRAFT_78454 [Pseudocercospora fijiensis CIRAD86]